VLIYNCIVFSVAVHNEWCYNDDLLRVEAERFDSLWRPVWIFGFTSSAVLHELIISEVIFGAYWRQRNNNNNNNNNNNDSFVRIHCYVSLQS